MGKAKSKCPEAFPSLTGIVRRSKVLRLISIKEVRGREWLYLDLIWFRELLPEDFTFPAWKYLFGYDDLLSRLPDKG